jgi:hypothetical protein
MYEDAGCTGKTRYVSPGEAYNRVVLAQRKPHKKHKRNNRGHLKVYRCVFCKMWHVGSSFEP